MKKLGFDLILLGDPASGKDTQAALLQKKYALQPVESGKYWRKMLYAKTREGALFRKTRILGQPAPVELIKNFLERSVSKAAKNKNLVFVGTPRLKPEAQLLTKLLRDKNRDFFAVYIKLSDQDVFKRSLGRIRTDKEGQRKYIQNRIDWHKHQVSKSVKYFKSLNRMKIINGHNSIKQVSQDIQKAINDYSRSSKN